MRAAGIDSFGGGLRVLDLAVPGPPRADEVMISVRAAGVGSWDEIVRVGGWDVGRRPLLALGVEAAGVVAAVGADVANLAPGDDVLTHPVPLRDQGAWAERLTAPAALVARKPAVTDLLPWRFARPLGVTVSFVSAAAADELDGYSVGANRSLTRSYPIAQGVKT